MAKKKAGKKRTKSSAPKQATSSAPDETSSESSESTESEDNADASDTSESSGTSESSDGADSSGSARSAAEKKPKAAPRDDPEDDRASSAPDKAEAPAAEGAAWAKPLVRIEKAVTWFEVRLLIVIILSLVFALVAWVSLTGMSSPVESQSLAGVAFRGFAGALVLGSFAAFVTRRLKASNVVTGLAGIVAIALGFILAPSWRSTGVEYFGHVQNWLQEGSSLTMFGGLRGVSTRFTIVLAFIGGSLAAASGKHINIDIALRLVSKRMKFHIFVIQTLATVAFCVVAAWAFFEYIAITNFNAPLDSTRSAKVEHVKKAVSQDLFLYRKQIGFDLDATSHVLGGGKWDDESRLNGRQWNEFLDSSGYSDYFTTEQIEALRARPDSLEGSRLALAIGPDGQPRNQLIRTMNLTFTVGFLVMALRFLLRLLLVVTGHQRIDEEEAA